MTPYLTLAALLIASPFIGLLIGWAIFGAPTL